LQKFEQTFTNGIADLSKIRVRRINRTKERGIFGICKINGPIDESYKYKITLYKKQGGQYRLMPYNFPLAEWCSAINNDPFIMPDIVKRSNMTLPIDCPISNVSKDLVDFVDFNCNLMLSGDLHYQRIPTQDARCTFYRYSKW
jgi:hypothetical protein